MKRTAYIFLLVLALSPAHGFAQGRFMYAIDVNGLLFWNYTPNPPVVTYVDYISRFPGYILGGIEVGYFSWDDPSYSVQALFMLSDFESLDIVPVIKFPFISSEVKFYAIAGPEMIVGLGDHASEKAIFAIYGGLGLATHMISYADFNIELGYSHGINNISQDNTNTYLRAIRLQLGILFGK